MIVGNMSRENNKTDGQKNRNWNNMSAVFGPLFVGLIFATIGIESSLSRIADRAGLFILGLLIFGGPVLVYYVFKYNLITMKTKRFLRNDYIENTEQKVDETAKLIEKFIVKL